MGADTPQTLCIWDWTLEASDPIHRIELNTSLQINIRINPSAHSEFLTYGASDTMFYSWSPADGIVAKEPINNEKNLNYELRNISNSIFFDYGKDELGHQAMTVLSRGEVVVWQNRNFVDLQKRLADGQRAALQITKFQSSSITFIDNLDDGENKYLITGSANGQIHVFDMDLRLMWWYNLSKSAEIPYYGSIKHISFDPTDRAKGIFPDLYVMTSLGQLFLIETEHEKVQQILDDANTTKKRNKDPFKLQAYAASVMSETLRLGANTSCILDFPFSTISCLQTSPVEPHIIVAGESSKFTLPSLFFLLF